VFHKQTGLLGTVTVVAVRSHALGLLALRLLVHDIHLSGQRISGGAREMFLSGH
jgi:hypothetical protein